MVFVRFLCRTVTLFPRFHTIFFWKKSLCAAHTEKVGNFRGSIYIDYLVLFCLLPHLFAYSIIFYNSVNTLIFIDILGCNLLLPYLFIYSNCSSIGHCSSFGYCVPLTSPCCRFLFSKHFFISWHYKMLQAHLVYSQGIFPITFPQHWYYILI